MKKLTLLAMAILMAFGAFGTATIAQPNDEPIVIGSKDFTENQLLAWMIYLTLEAEGYDVENRINLGGTSINRDALLAGEIDVYPEYTGTALTLHFPAEFGYEAGPGVTTDPVVSYVTVHALDAAENGLVWLQPSPANNVYAFAVLSDFAEENGLETVADLAEYVNAGNEVLVATNDEFATRPDGIESFEVTYGFEFSDEQLAVQAGAIPAQTLQTLNEDDSVNIGMAYGTAGSLVAYDMILLEDPDNAQPIYANAPVFREEAIVANPEIIEILTPVFAPLDNATQQSLNAAVDVDGLAPEDVARDFLIENGFIDG